MKITTLISELDHGQVEQRLSEQLSAIIEAVQETGQQGKLTVTLAIAKEGMQVVVDVQSVEKRPQHPMHGTLFFFGRQPGTLSREDPRQLKLTALPERKPVTTPED